jgi:hypothetical protein
MRFVRPMLAVHRKQKHRSRKYGEAGGLTRGHLQFLGGRASRPSVTRVGQEDPIVLAPPHYRGSFWARANVSENTALRAGIVSVFGASTRCSVPVYGGTGSHAVDKDGTWGRFFTGAPARRRQSVFGFLNLILVSDTCCAGPEIRAADCSIKSRESVEPFRVADRIRLCHLRAPSHRRERDPSLSHRRLDQILADDLVSVC